MVVDVTAQEKGCGHITKSHAHTATLEVVHGFRLIQASAPTDNNDSMILSQRLLTIKQNIQAEIKKSEHGKMGKNPD